MVIDKQLLKQAINKFHSYIKKCEVIEIDATALNVALWEEAYAKEFGFSSVKELKKCKALYSPPEFKNGKFKCYDFIYIYALKKACGIE